MNKAPALLLAVSGVLTAVSGAIYAIARYLLVSDDPFAAYNHPIQPWALSLHILSAPALVFMLGWIWQSHVRKARQDPPPRIRIGAALSWLVVPMVSTGYLLQVISHEAFHTALAWVHGITGAAFFLGLAVHAGISVREGLKARATDLSDPETAPAPSSPPI